LAFSTIQGSGAAPDSFVGTSGVDSILLQDVRKSVFLGAQADNDVIEFKSFTDLVSGYTLKGGQGNDTIAAVGGIGFGTNISNSLINGNAGDDLIDLSLVSSSSVFGGQGNDTFLADLSNTVLNGNAGADTINVFSAVSSSVFGGQGLDKVNVSGNLTDVVVQGDKDFDTIIVNNLTSLLNATINGNDGNDLITVNKLVSFTNSTIFGGEGADTITALTADVAVYLSGDAGDDNLTGGIGADTIEGGDGIDVMTGGTGNDSFLYTSVAQTGTVATTGSVGNDRITDFTSGAGATVADSIKGFGVAGNGTTYTEGTVASLNYAAALAEANDLFQTAGAANTFQYYYAVFESGANFTGVLFVDLGNTGAAQGAIQIGDKGSFLTAGAAFDGFKAQDILA
jgi:Ca2+-binding RTX toxin-like protein